MEIDKYDLPGILNNLGLVVESEFVHKAIFNKPELNARQRYQSRILDTVVHCCRMPPHNANYKEIWIDVYTFSPMVKLKHVRLNYDFWISLFLLSAFNVQDQKNYGSPLAPVFINNIRDVESFIYDNYGGKFSLQTLSEHELLIEYSMENPGITVSRDYLEWTYGSYGTSAEKIAMAGNENLLSGFKLDEKNRCIVDERKIFDSAGIRLSFHKSGEDEYIDDMFYDNAVNMLLSRLNLQTI